MRAAFDPSHRVVDRLGRPGAAHPHRDGRHAAARPSRAPRDRRTARTSCRRRARAGSRRTALPIAYKKPRGLARDAQLARASTARVRRRQHAQLDRRVAGRARGRDASAACRRSCARGTCRRRSTTRWTTRWLYQRATRAHRRDRRGAEGAARARQRLRSVAHHVGAHGHRPRALPSARSRSGARAAAASTRGRRSAIVATLRDWKGHDDLLDAWSRVRERVPGWQLLVIGDGPRRAHLERRVAAMGLRSDVRFTGNQDDVPAWFACARHRGAAVVRRRGRAAEPHAGGGVRLARRLHADRRDRRGGASTARPACSCRRAT